MIRPFREIFPLYYWIYSCLIGFCCWTFILLWDRKRIHRSLLFLKSLTLALPKWFILINTRRNIWCRTLLITTFFSLIPWGITPFHYPTLGVGLSISIWITIVGIRIRERLPQFIKEYFNDPSLSSFWARICLIIERGRRIVRAITLGGRISVNIIIGSILYRVIGETISRWGLFILCVLEILVISVQTYVFILLICFYTSEAE